MVAEYKPAGMHILIFCCFLHMLHVQYRNNIRDAQITVWHYRFLKQPCLTCTHAYTKTRVTKNALSRCFNDLKPCLRMDERPKYTGKRIGLQNIPVNVCKISARVSIRWANKHRWSIWLYLTVAQPFCVFLLTLAFCLLYLAKMAAIKEAVERGQKFSEIVWGIW